VLLVRHFLQGHNQCALAGELRTSPATVSRRIKSAVDDLRARLNKKGVIIAAALLVTMMREHGAQAAPAELMRELGKITMLSGGKPATATLTPVSYASTWWWVSAVVTLSIVFAWLCTLALPKMQPAAPAQPATQEYREGDAQSYRDARLQTLRKAGLGE